MNRFGRFVRYAKHHDDSESVHEGSRTKAVHESEKEDKSCGKEKDDSNAMLKHFDWFKSFMHREKLQRDNSEDLRKTQKAHETYEEESDDAGESEDDEEVSEDDESYFDGRDENENDRSKVARSIDSASLDPGTTEVCEDGGNCKDNNNGQDRAFGFMDSTSGNSKKTSNIALKAAQEAKAAEDAQETAGKEASKQAKFQLAEKAIQAAKAAQAALSAKQAIVEELERELRESETVVQDLSSSIQQSEANTNAALRAAQQAAAQLKMLTEAVQTAQSNLANSEIAAQGAQQELSEKTQLLEAAKNRVESLLRELKTARTDYSNTKQAAYKAASAAKQAKTNAWVFLISFLEFFTILYLYFLFSVPATVAVKRWAKNWCKILPTMSNLDINNCRKIPSHFIF